MTESTVYYAGYFTFWFLASIPLGPNAVNSIRYGAAAPGMGWMLAPLGTTAAAIVFCAIVLTGFGLFVTERPWLQIAIRLAGGIYLTYLGGKILMSVFDSSRRKGADIDVSGTLTTPLRDGFLISMTNPKPIILYSSVLSSYLTFDSLYSAHNVIILAITITTVLIVYMAYGILGKFAVTLFRREKVFILVEILAGGSFIFLAAVILFETFHYK
jgi:threonine/homoserine/homoserine lactone efflux protein